MKTSNGQLDLGRRWGSCPAALVFNPQLPERRPFFFKMQAVSGAVHNSMVNDWSNDLVTIKPVEKAVEIGWNAGGPSGACAPIIDLCPEGKPRGKFLEPKIPARSAEHTKSELHASGEYLATVS